MVVLSTPGHTPEHVTYVVTDRSRADVPVLAFTGGDLLVGAVGRPDPVGGELGEKLARVGFENVVGYLRAGMEGWASEGLPPDQLPQWDVHDLKRSVDAGAVTVLDVRTEAELESGSISGAIHIRLDQLPEQADSLAGVGHLAVVCGSGFRSSIGASLLAQRGHREVANVAGGMGAWETAGYPTDQEPEELEALPAAA